MANISANPWSIVPGDVVTSVPTALTLNADGTVSLTTAAAHNLAVGNGVTLIGNTPAAYNGYYIVLVVPSATTATLQPANALPTGTGVGTVFGTAGKNLYNAHVRIEDISWQNQTAAGQSLDLRDRNGNPIWQATSTGAGQQNRGKVFWVFGITPFAVASGVVLVTVN